VGREDRGMGKIEGGRGEGPKMCMHGYMHTYIGTWIHTYVCIQVYIYIYVYIHTKLDRYLGAYVTRMYPGVYIYREICICSVLLVLVAGRLWQTSKKADQQGGERGGNGRGGEEKGVGRVDRGVGKTDVGGAKT